MIDQGNFGYGMTSRGNVHNLNSCVSWRPVIWPAILCWHESIHSVKKDLQEQMMYYNSADRRKGKYGRRKTFCRSYLKGIEQIKTVMIHASRSRVN
jgi:hypothetical protein